jgi:adenylate kinase family enzyme
VDFYRGLGRLKIVDAEGAINEVSERLAAALD